VMWIELKTLWGS